MPVRNNAREDGRACAAVGPAVRPGRRTCRRTRRRTRRRAHSARAARARSRPARAPRGPRPAARWWGSVRRSRSLAGAAAPPLAADRPGRREIHGRDRRAAPRDLRPAAPTWPVPATVAVAGRRLWRWRCRRLGGRDPLDRHHPLAAGRAGDQRGRADDEGRPRRARARKRGRPLDRGRQTAAQR